MNLNINNCSYTEIAERLNLTRNQIIAIERRAMKKIKSCK
ncbi:MAG: sigma-70 family RNA polymerase sigma factor [Arcobacter sp.]|nr:sigma-70 family RNA polymerase sigma factor [Arcobacter sp.]